MSTDNPVLPTYPASLNKAFWTSFINLYKEQQCLWNGICADFKSETMRSMAYGLLLEKLWEVDPTATETTVKNKLIGFHRYYKAKKQVIEASKPDEPWFYGPYLDFMNSPYYFSPEKEEKPDDALINPEVMQDDVSSSSSVKKKRRVNTYVKPTISVTEIEKTMKLGRGKQKKSWSKTIAVGGNSGQEVTLQFNANESEDDSLDSSLVMDCPVPTIEINEVAEEPPVKRQATEIISVQGNVVNQDNEDDCSTFGAHLVTRMRTFDPQQKLIAQKLISDVMFLAGTKLLSMSSVVRQ